MFGLPVPQELQDMLGRGVVALERMADALERSAEAGERLATSFDEAMFDDDEDDDDPSDGPLLILDETTGLVPVPRRDA
ncbi:hypothetical protein [Rhodococcus sp. 11-3]|uniref:hypothetical protein n=1 Tax=Rhodococcus sp. 11-3 TaxID=2854796 RepID=UPI0020408F58|nr:hypothetical protein [Rhodococcus sp. 11-3]USC16988.1 hypothetical protein KZJ41_09035 [Rhodococcus sp. 11-3]